MACPIGAAGLSAQGDVFVICMGYTTVDGGQVPYELLVLREGEVSHAIPLSDAPVQIGRAPGSHIAIPDSGVSWHHAQVWVQQGQVFVRDLGSRNGTFVNDEPVHGPTPVTPRDEVRVAPRISLKLRKVGAKQAHVFEVRYLEDLTANVRFLVAGDRFHIGSGPDAHLRIEGLPARAATLTLHANGEIWLGTEEDEYELALDAEFTVAERTMRVVAGEADHLPTVDFGQASYPYRLVGITQGVDGPEARLVDVASNNEWFTAGNRGVLLYLLARQLQRDEEQGIPVEDRGWVSDTDVSTGVWGKAGAGKTSLNVLVHRVRQHLEKAGFDPWFIEKRRGGIRARLRLVEVY